MAWKLSPLAQLLPIATTLAPSSVVAAWGPRACEVHVHSSSSELLRAPCGYRERSVGADWDCKPLVIIPCSVLAATAFTTTAIPSALAAFTLVASAFSEL